MSAGVAGVVVVLGLIGAGAFAVAPALASDREAGQVARGQIIVQLDTIVTSPQGDPNTYQQIKFFQDFTGDFTGMASIHCCRSKAPALRSGGRT